MSAAYTLHVTAHATPGDPGALDRSDLVRDGFSWGAFLAPALFFIGHRHWLLALGSAVVVVALAAGSWVAGARIATILAAELLLHGLIGFEAATLRRWALGGRGRPAVDVVYAASEAEAETKFFARWLADRDAGAAPRAALPPARNPWPRRHDDHVIGMFPDQEGRQ